MIKYITFTALALLMIISSAYASDNITLKDLPVFTCTEIHVDGSPGFESKVSAKSQDRALELIGSQYRLSQQLMDNVSKSDYHSELVGIKLFRTRGGCATSNLEDELLLCAIKDVVCK